MKERIKMKVGLMIAALTMSVGAFGGSVYVKFDAQGGTFAIAGMLMETGKTADSVITEKGYAAPTRFGYDFAGWSSIKSPKDEEELAKGCQDYYETALTVATTFYAIWNPKALSTDGNGVWSFTNDVLECVITNGSYASSCYQTVSGRGWLSFEARVVNAKDETQEFEFSTPTFSYSSSNDDYFGVGMVVRYVSKDPLKWKTVKIPVRDVNGGQVALEFYCNSYSEAKLQISNLVWTAATDMDEEKTISFDLAGGSWTNEQASSVVRSLQYGELPTPVRSGCTFYGWSEGDYVYSYHVAVSSDTYLPLETNVVLRAMWNVPPENVLDPTGALRDSDQGNSLCVSVSSGHVESRWVRQDGQAVWQGEYLGWSPNGNETLFSATVNGCGSFQLEIAARSSQGNLSLSVVVDGVSQEFTLANGFLSFDIPNSGSHSVSLASKSLSGYGWMYCEVGALTWTPAAAELQVSFDTRGGEMDGETTRTFATGAAYGELPTPTRKGYVFAGWFTAAEGGAQVVATDNVRPSATTLYARWTCPLKTALGGDLRYASQSGWIGTTEQSRDGSGDAVAGVSDLRWGVTNVLATAVRGRGILSLWCRPGGDLFGWNWMSRIYLGELQYDGSLNVGFRSGASFSIWIDGECVWNWNYGSLSSPVDGWRKVVLPIEKSGLHVVEWRYCPGGSVGDEAICGSVSDWKKTAARSDFLTYQNKVVELSTGACVDDVKWTPADEVADLVPWGRGVIESRAWLTGVLANIEAAYSAKIAAEPSNYEWVVLRALTKVVQLGENERLRAILAKFGYEIDYQHLGKFFGELDYEDAPLSNEVVDALAAEAVPALESALKDLESIPDSWTGSIRLSPGVYPFVDEDTYLDLADVTFVKAGVKGALAALAVAESYDLSFDYMNVDYEVVLNDLGLRPTCEDLVLDHEAFAKRVRDAERLAEGKELLREGLKILQTADSRMLARSSSELHFFEYVERHADDLQSAREEVAKALTALDAAVVLTDADFSRLDKKVYRVTDLNQSVTLQPFFEGVLTRRYLPTEYDENGMFVFDSFPTMAFGGIAPGLTKQTVAGWLSLYGVNVTCTPDSDYEPAVVYRTFSAAIPALGATATKEEITDALAGSADVAVALNVTDAESYSDYEAWASSLSVPLKTVKASSYAWLSYSLASPTLLTKDVTTDDLKVESFTPSLGGDGFSFVVGVDGVTLGSTATAEALKGVFDVEGAESLAEDSFDSANVDVKFTSPEDGKLKFSASPKKSASTFFMRIKRK